MNNSIIVNTTRFLVLLLSQIVIFNNIDFLGFINPYPYILFILLFPIGDNRALLLCLSFFLGLTLDMFGDSGGMHAAACTVIAYARPWAMRSVFGVAYEYNTIRVTNTAFGERFVYFSILILMHHFVLFFMEVFAFSDILFILRKTLFSGIFTLVVSLIFVTLFSKRHK